MEITTIYLLVVLVLTAACAYIQKNWLTNIVATIFLIMIVDLAELKPGINHRKTLMENETMNFTVIQATRNLLHRIRSDNRNGIIFSVGLVILVFTKRKKVSSSNDV